MANDDRRHEGRQFPVARYEFDTLTFPAVLSAAKSATLSNINGAIEAIEIVIADTQDGITYTAAITSVSSAALYSEGSLADNQTHYKKAISHKSTQDADFNPIPVNGTLTLTVTPSAAPDAGNIGAKTATVQVKIYLK